MGVDRSHSQKQNRRSSGSAFFIAWAASLIAASSPALAADTVAQAAREGDFSGLQALINAGASVNLAEADGSTALLWAAYQGDPEMAALLLDAGADPDAANRFGVTPLLQAARIGSLPVIDALLEGGADVSSAMVSGETPLMAVSRAGNVEAVSLLLSHGSDPDAAESYQGQTALMWAAAEGHADVVRVLLDAGADPNITARVTSLTERSMRTDFPSGGFTAAMWAAREGHEDVLRLLADAGADLAAKNADGATAMMVAIVNDRFDLAASMLDMGAEADNGSLYYAVLMRDATSDWLAKDGSRWRADYPNERTALDLIGDLLAAGADPNAVFEGQMHSTSMCCDTRESGTPFYRAAVAADVAALELLIEYGADVEWTPEPAESAGGPGGMGGGGSPRSALASAMNGGRGVGMAGGPGDIRENRPPPFREEANRTPADAVRVLLQAGADPNRATGNNSTMLHEAARARDLDMIRALADHGATLDALNGAGLTALDVAEGRRGEGAPGGGRRGFGGGAPGMMGGNDDRPSNEEVAALLRELMTAQGVAIVEHGTASGPEENTEEDG